MSQIETQINDAADAIRRRWKVRPRVGIILGTGLATFSDQIEREAVLRYDEIPHFPASTALGHSGQLVCGTIGGVPVATMEGRFHLYEGYPLPSITLPVRVMHALGIEALIVSNASGGLNPNLAVGDVLIIEDHLNLMFANPLVGPEPPSSVPRVPSTQLSLRPAIDRPGSSDCPAAGLRGARWCVRGLERTLLRNPG